MKNIFEIMKEYGLEVSEDKKKDFEKAVLENYKTVKDYENQSEKLEKANETIKANDTTISGIQKKLDEFKDVDVSALKKQIEDLEKEKGTIEAEYQGKLADRDFGDLTKEVITAAHGKNVKAITALLDLDTLKASKNQREDITAAVKQLTEAEDSKMLFGENDSAGSITNPIGSVGGNGNANTATAEMRAIMGLPPVK